VTKIVGETNTSQEHHDHITPLLDRLFEENLPDMAFDMAHCQLYGGSLVYRQQTVDPSLSSF
jgi:hypothetical protein